jgi:signal peptidase II
MRKIDWLLVIVPLFFTWGIDRVTKAWAVGLQGVTFYGPLGFVLHHNHGAMLGLFSEAPSVIRIVSLSTGGAFLLFFFVVIQYLLPIKSLILRSGMSVLLGGILGNVTDRIIYGHVIDFILLGTRESSSPAFNLADALQWVGYAMIAYALIRESEILWPTENTRKQNWVNLRFQLRYCFILMGVGVGFASIAGVYSYTFLRVTIIEFGGNNPRILERYLTPFILSYLAVVLTFAAILFLLGRVLSSRVAGPLYAFEKFLDDLLAGKPRVLRLRAGDEFRHLEKLAERVAKTLAEKGLNTNLAPADKREKPIGAGVLEVHGGGGTGPDTNAAVDPAPTTATAADPAAPTTTTPTGGNTGTNG